MRHLHLLSFALVLAASAMLPRETMAATVYANWLKVKTIEYNAAANAYTVTFEGATTTFETEPSGVPCGDYSAAVFIANAVGVGTTDQEVDRMVSALEIARATGLRVRLWAHQCSSYTSALTFPKAYMVITKE